MTKFAMYSMSCKLKCFSFQVLSQSFGFNLYPRGCLGSKFPIPSLLKHDNFDWLRGNEVLRNIASPFNLPISIQSGLIAI